MIFLTLGLNVGDNLVMKSYEEIVGTDASQGRVGCTFMLRVKQGGEGGCVVLILIPLCTWPISIRQIEISRRFTGCRR